MIKSKFLEKFQIRNVSMKIWWSKCERSLLARVNAQKMKFSIMDFFSKCDQNQRRLRIWSRLLEKPLMENFIFYAVCALFKLRS